MANLSLKAKLNFLVFTPLLFAYVVSCFALTLTHSPILIVAMTFIFISIAAIANIFIKSFSKKMMNTLKHLQDDVEAVNFSAKLLNKEIEKVSFDSEDFEELKVQLSEMSDPLVNLSEKAQGLRRIYADMKVLVLMSMREAGKPEGDKKFNLALAKELGNLCLEVKQTEVEIQELILASLSKVPNISEKIHDVQVLASGTDKHLLISENIIGMTLRLDRKINAINHFRKETKAPLKTASLRRVIKLSENRAA